MADFQRKPSASPSAPQKDAHSTGLGRGFNSLTKDNTPKEKKPLVVRRGVVENPTRPIVRSTDPRVPKSYGEAAGVGGRVVIKTEDSLVPPVRSGRNARKGTTVLIRTMRDDPPKKYRVNEHSEPRDPRDVRLPRPIVINPRNKK